MYAIFMIKNCCSHKSFKTSIKSWINFDRVIQFNQKAWSKPYIDMNTKFRKEAKNDFEKDFFKLMNNAVFGKTMENVRKHRDIKLVTTNKRRNYLVSEAKYHTTKWFSENLMYDFCMIILNQSIKIMQNYVTWIQTALLFILKEKMYVEDDIADDVETRSDTSNYEVECNSIDRP